MNARQYYASIAKDREAWKSSQKNRCMYCHFIPRSMNKLQIHEIERRSHCKGRWAARCNMLVLCETCHSTVFATMSHAEQLSIKIREDPDNYDLQEWLRLKDVRLAAPFRVTEDDVAMWRQDNA